MLKEITKVPFEMFKFSSTSLDGFHPQFNFRVFRTEKWHFYIISKDQNLDAILE